MIERVARRMFTAEVIGLTLVALALQTLNFGISSSLQNTDTKYLFLVCIAASLTGWGLGKIKWNGIQASVGMVALGIAGVWILGARLFYPLLDLVESLLPVISQIVPAIREGTSIDTSAVADSWDIIVQASLALKLRLQTWLIGFNTNVTVNDALIRNMVWTLVMWLFAAWMGWFTARRNAIASLLPSILLLATITSYSERRIETLWLMVFILLLLMGVWNYKNHISQWEKHSVDYSESIQVDANGAAVLLAMTIGVIAFITPSVSWREIRDYLRERTQSSENQTADLLGIQEEQIAPQNTSLQRPILPREHLLTGGYAQSQDIVMTIRTGELPPVTDPALTAKAPRYYWRSVVYDVYKGAGWVTSTAPAQTYQANTPLIPGLLNGYRLIHLDVKMQEPQGNLFWSGMLFSADVPFTANWRVRPPTSLFADQSALIQADMFAALSNTDAYRAESFIQTASVEKLRAASTDYPVDVRERFLALPSSLPERVHRLAEEITAKETNPYNKAKAIETYLRTKYPYDLEVPAPPPDRDVADYFLFDLKKGYCDYYATAMVVLARSSGIPARFVSGFSSGSYDAPNAQYVIRELNAHSWVEVYFPEVGWVEFEPTASQPEIIRAEKENSQSSSEGVDIFAKEALQRFRLVRAAYWMIPVAIFLIFSVFYYTVIEKWLYLRLAPALAIDRIYRRLYLLGRPLAGERTRGETAFEFFNKLSGKAYELSRNSRFSKSLSHLQNEAAALTDLYHSTLFRDYHAQKKDAHIAWHTWKHLRWHLLIARVVLFKANRTLKANRK